MQGLHLEDYENRHSLRSKVARGVWMIVWAVLFRPTPRGRLFMPWRAFLLRCFGARGECVAVVPGVAAVALDDGGAQLSFGAGGLLQCGGNHDRRAGGGLAGCLSLHGFARYRQSYHGADHGSGYDWGAGVGVRAGGGVAGGDGGGGCGRRRRCRGHQGCCAMGHRRWQSGAGDWPA